MKSRQVEYPGRTISVIAEADVLIVGGGPAGCAAAIRSARSGAKTVLVERLGFLGGTLTAVTLGGFCGGYALKKEELVPIVGGVYREIIDKLKICGGVMDVVRSGNVHGVPYDSELLKAVLDDFLEDAGVEVILHSRLVDVIKDGASIDMCVISTIAGIQAIKAKRVVDCSGNADVASLSGVPVRYGVDGAMQFPSTMFRLSGVRGDAIKSYSRQEVTEILENLKRDGVPVPRTAIALYENPVKDVCHLNCTRIAKKNGEAFDLTDPRQLSMAEKEGRKQAFLYQDICRAELEGFENARVVSIGTDIGIRESRNIIGDYTLTDEDFRNAIKPEDGVVSSAWPAESHRFGHKTGWEFLDDGQYYKIPYRSLIAKNVDNLLVAGRCLSAEPLAQASARVTATCMGMGEAVGLAAAMSIREYESVRGVDVVELVDSLRESGSLMEI